MIKKMMLTLTILSFLCTITGCATTQYKGQGQVLAAKKISDQDYKPHTGTKVGAIVGGSAGAIGGAAVGGAFGFALAALCAEDTLGMFSLALGAGAVGAVIVGVAGGVIGGSAGYAVDVLSHPATYQFTVKPSYQAEPITITQYSSFIPVNAEVRIVEKDHMIYIKKN